MTCSPRDQAKHLVDLHHENDDWSFLRKHPTTRTFKKVDELIQLVAQRAGIPPAQAALAISAMLSYLTAHLPSPVVGRIRELFGESQPSCHPEGGQGDVK